jgi:hypothetical protein
VMLWEALRKYVMIGEPDLLPKQRLLLKLLYHMEGKVYFVAYLWRERRGVCLV